MLTNPTALITLVNGKRRLNVELTLSFCGFRCDLCLAYRPNIEKHPENQELLSDGWHRYFGFRINPEDIVCDGCKTGKIKTLDRDCPVRPCAMERNINTCADCEDYICENLTERLISFDEIQARFEQSISSEDRQHFIFPYENIQRLAELRGETSKPAG